MSVDITKGATVELVKTLSDDLRTKDDNTKYSSAGAAMRDKANADGYYDGMTVGNAEQLLSSVYEEDSEPYLFRTSGGSIDIGDREEDTIVGGTVAWNQQWQVNSQSETATANTNNASVLISGYVVNYVAGHKYLATYEQKTTMSSNTRNTLGYNDGTNHFQSSNTNNNLSAGRYSWIFSPSASKSNGNIWIWSHTPDVDVVYSNPQIFDLTQIFGSTIADYIYSLETATAGAGVAWFKKLFPKSYYSYDARSLKSVEGLSAHEMTGFNQWDEEWEVGGIANATGLNFNASDRIRSKNFNPCLPNTIYYNKMPVSYSNIFYYNNSKTFISQTPVNGGVTFTTPQNCAYFRFSVQPDYGNTYNNDICINLSWDGERDGEYEPYVKHSYPLDDSLTLRGVFKLDENNKLRCDGDVYHADGTVERKYGVIVLDGSSDEDWQEYSVAQGELHRFVNLPRKYGTIPSVGLISDKYRTVSVKENRREKTISGSGTFVDIIDSTYATIEQWKAYIAQNPITLVYELATPTTEEAEPYQTPQIVDDFGTEEYVTDSIVPVGHVTKYMPNLKAKLEMAPDSPSDNGDYIVRHTNGQNEYVPLVIPTELPAMPTGSDGTYVLKATVTNGTATLSWESES